MIRRRARRRVRAACLRGLRVVRRHHFSLLSAGVLGVALAIALTSSSSEIHGNTPSEAAALPASTLQPTVAAGLVEPPSTPLAEQRSFVFYFVGSQAKIDELQHALHRDLADEALISYKALHRVTRFFILIEDHRDEADALELLRQQALVPLDGSVVRVVDLR